MKTAIFTSDFADKIGTKFNHIDKLINRDKDWVNPFEDFKKFVQEKPKETVLTKTDNGWTLDVLLVGFEKNEITVDTSGSYIKIDAVRKEQKISELVKAKVSHNIYIGDMDEENITAVLKNGLLTLTIPSRERKSKIKID
jgi:HSP20 family molecular chaperone IbpA